MKTYNIKKMVKGIDHTMLEERWIDIEDDNQVLEEMVSKMGVEGDWVRWDEAKEYFNTLLNDIKGEVDCYQL